MKKFFLSIIFLIFIVSICFPYSYDEGNRWLHSNMPIKYKINTSNAPAGAIAVIDAAFSTWESAASSWIEFENDGIGNYTFQEDGVNSLSWGYAYGSIAMSARYDEYPIIEKDIVFNNISYNWSTTTPPQTGCMDVANIATHEIGHWLRLIDLYDSSDSDKTMYGYSVVEETKKRSLTSDDINGIRYIYI